jgi:hypothetical protein
LADGSIIRTKVRYQCAAIPISLCSSSSSSVHSAEC